MPMSTARFARITQQAKLWHIAEPEHMDHAALVDMFIECRNVLDEVLSLADEENEGDESASFFARIRAFFRG